MITPSQKTLFYKVKYAMITEVQNYDFLEEATLALRYDRGVRDKVVAKAKQSAVTDVWT
jgi:hypothetical protein